MSLILEALKKSEQQRQQQHSKQQQVRKRTLSLSSTRSGSRSYYLLLAGLVSLVFLSAGWFYSNMQVIVQESPDVTLTPSPPPAVSQPEPAEPAGKPSESPNVASQALKEPQAPPQAMLAVEPAPVPREFVDTEDTLPRPAATALVRTAPRKSRGPVTQPRQAEVMAPAAVQPNEQPVTSAPQSPSVAADDRMPLYQDLSEELRARMPDLKMSMHFYAKDPDRRLVRISGRLLHQGDWLSDDLQLVEITPNGVAFDYLGKSFVMIRSSR